MKLSVGMQAIFNVCVSQLLMCGSWPNVWRDYSLLAAYGRRPSLSALFSSDWLLVCVAMTLCVCGRGRYSWQLMAANLWLAFGGWRNWQSGYGFEATAISWRSAGGETAGGWLAGLQCGGGWLQPWQLFSCRKPAGESWRHLSLWRSQLSISSKPD